MNDGEPDNARNALAGSDFADEMMQHARLSKEKTGELTSQLSVHPGASQVLSGGQ